jgi:hypothetical protein
MAFGVSGIYLDGGEPKKFEGPWAQVRSIIRARPDASITGVSLYAHGSPTVMGDGDEYLDVDQLASLLRPKMCRAGGEVHLVACMTATRTRSSVNPTVGLMLAARSADFAAAGTANPSDNFAKTLSQRLRDTHVMGLSGVSFPISRLLPFTEGYRPWGLVGDARWYVNGQLTRAP